MPWVVPAVMAASALMSYEQNRKANSQAQDLVRNQGNTNQYMFDLTRSDLAPFRANELQTQGLQLGSLKDLVSKISSGPGDFKASDSYNWTLGQGINALDKSAVSKGVSKNADTMRFATGLASGEQDAFQSRWLKSLQPLQSVSNVAMTGASGQTANSNLGFANAGNNLTSSLSNLTLGQGQNQADFWQGLGALPLNYMLYNKMSA